MKAHVQSKKKVHMLAEEKAKTQKKSDDGDEVVGFGEQRRSVRPRPRTWHLQGAHTSQLLCVRGKRCKRLVGWEPSRR